jgi:hypothetical protein
VQLLADLVREHGGAIQKSLWDSRCLNAVIEYAIFCADVIRIAVTDSNWRRLEAIGSSSDTNRLDQDKDSDEESEQLEDEEENATTFEEIEEVVLICEGFFDAFASTIGPDVALPLLARVMKELEALDAEGDWRGLYARLNLMRASAEGCAPGLTPNILREWVNLCVGVGAVHPHPAVRHQAIGTLAQMANDIRENLLPYYSLIIPAYLKLMKDSYVA